MLVVVVVVVVVLLVLVGVGSDIGAVVVCSCGFCFQSLLLLSLLSSPRPFAIIYPVGKYKY